MDEHQVQKFSGRKTTTLMHKWSNLMTFYCGVVSADGDPQGTKVSS